MSDRDFVDQELGVLMTYHEMRIDDELPVWDQLPESTSSFEFNPEESGLVASPHLKIIDEPQNTFKFRYLKESVPHGPIRGSKSYLSNKKNNSGPKVHLANFTGDAIIRCWLTLPGSSEPHVHQLVETGKTVSDETRGPHDVKVNASNNYTASFDKLNIIHATMADVDHQRDYWKRKHLINADFNATSDSITTPFDREEIKKEMKAVEKNLASLCFQAFALNNGQYERICDAVISRGIRNTKNPKWSELKIYKYLPSYGSCKGNDDVIVLVDKIAKDVKIRFYQVNDVGVETWEAEVLPDQIHKQVAIIFRTPQFPLRGIDQPTEVFFKVIRNGDESVPNKFIYLPSKSATNDNGKKRRIQPLDDRMDSMYPDLDFNLLDAIDFFNGLEADGIRHTEIAEEPTIRFQGSDDCDVEKLQCLERCNEAGETTLLRAIKENRVQIVEKILNIFPEFIKQRTLSGGDGPFHVAVKNRRSEIIRILLKMNFNWNEVNSFNETPLHYAVRHEDSDLIELLLSSSQVDIRPKLFGNSENSLTDSSSEDDERNDKSLEILKGPPLRRSTTNRKILNLLLRLSTPRRATNTRSFGIGLTLIDPPVMSHLLATHSAHPFGVVSTHLKNHFTQSESTESIPDALSNLSIVD